MTILICGDTKRRLIIESTGATVTMFGYILSLGHFKALSSIRKKFVLAISNVNGQIFKWPNVEKTI